jgi:hypothetical protein
VMLPTRVIELELVDVGKGDSFGGSVSSITMAGGIGIINLEHGGGGDEATSSSSPTWRGLRETVLRMRSTSFRHGSTTKRFPMSWAIVAGQ